jgi:hypothetical protein
LLANGSLVSSRCGRSLWRGRRPRRAVPERVWATPEQVVRIAERAGLLGGPIVRLLVITAAWPAPEQRRSEARPDRDRSAGGRGSRDEGGVRGDPAGVDLPRAAAQPQDLADRRRCTGDRQARRLGQHLDNRVIETYSHVAPEVEQRLLDDLERRWHTAAPPPPTPSPSVVHSPAGHGSSGNIAPTLDQGWGSAPVLLQQEHKIARQDDHRRSNPIRRKPLRPATAAETKGFLKMWS